MKPSPAANALLVSLSLPPGAAVIWPATRDGQTKLVVRLNNQFWDRSKGIPSQFEGYSVIVEPNQPVSAQALTSESPVWDAFPGTRTH